MFQPEEELWIEHFWNKNHNVTKIQVTTTIYSLNKSIYQIIPGSPTIRDF